MRMLKCVSTLATHMTRTLTATIIALFLLPLSAQVVAGKALATLAAAP